MTSPAVPLHLSAPARRAWAGLAGLILVAGLALAAAGLALTAPAAGAGTPPGTPGSTIRWSSCPAEELAAARCGTLTVPADWSRPRGATITLALVVRPAEKPEERIGPLLLNNGSGGSAIEQLRLGLQTGAIRGALAERFDLVAVDPRAVGQSTPVRCGRPQRSPSVTYFPDDERAFAALVADNRALADACRRETGAVLEHLDLRSTARDLDAVRRALGEPQVVLYGIERSTLVGRTYARMFPRTLRGIVLDTALDDSLPPVQRLASEVVAVETGLNRFADWCAGAEECSLRGQDVLERFDELVAQADRASIPAGDRPPLTGEDVRRAVQEKLVFKLAWPGFAAALEEAAAGDATALATPADATLDTLQDHVVRCATTPPAASTFAELQELERMVRELAPQTGGASRAWDTAAGCIGWPGRPDRPDSGRPARGAPPALLLQSTHNTLSAYENAFSLARQLPGSRVLSRAGDDYSLVIWSPCAAAGFEAYATVGRLPAPGTLCLD
jgi:pimeloyl-ACP methyl ester carboxylesterase